MPWVGCKYVVGAPANWGERPQVENKFSNSIHHLEKQCLFSFFLGLRHPFDSMSKLLFEATQT